MSLLLLAFAGAAGLALHSRKREPPPPAPPEVDLNGLDRTIVASVEAARARVSQSPRSASAWGHLGKVLIAHELRAPALVCFAEAEQLDPAEPRWPYLQGVALSQGDPDAALPKLRRAVELCGRSPDAPRLWLAEVLLEQGHFDEAEKHFRAILKQNPSNPRAFLGLGRLALARDRLQDGLEPLKRASTSPYVRQRASTLLAQVQQRLGQSKEAAQELRRAAALPGDLPWPDPFVEEVARLQVGERARLGQARALINQGQAAEGVHLLGQIVRDYPDSYSAWLMRGQALFQLREFADAERALQEAIRLAPEAVDAQYALGCSFLEQGKLADAATSLRRAIELKPDYALAYYQLSRCLNGQHDRAGALAALRDAVRYKPDLADAHAALGEQLAQDGQKAEALVHLRYAASLGPLDPKRKGLLEQMEKEAAAPGGP
jgi:tetratricopeptide (TPR) repeat protein